MTQYQVFWSNGQVPSNLLLLISSEAVSELLVIIAGCSTACDHPTKRLGTITHLLSPVIVSLWSSCRSGHYLETIGLATMGWPSIRPLSGRRGSGRHIPGHFGSGQCGLGHCGSGHRGSACRCHDFSLAVTGHHGRD